MRKVGIVVKPSLCDSCRLPKTVIVRVWDGEKMLSLCLDCFEEYKKRVLTLRGR
jgi:hypothetical protein